MNQRLTDFIADYQTLCLRYKMHLSTMMDFTPAIRDLTQVAPMGPEKEWDADILEHIKQLKRNEEELEGASA